jgi:hypothetical protein
MSDTAGLTTLTKTVKKYLAYTGLGYSHYNEVFSYGIDGLTDLHLYTLTPIVNTVKRTPSDIGVVDYPSDLQQLTGVYRESEGELYPIPKKTYLDFVYTRTLANGVETQDSDYGEDTSQDTGDSTYQYGTRGSRDDYYWYDDQIERRIIVEGSPVETVWLKYVSSGVSTSADSVQYPRKAEQCLMAFIHYQRACFDVKGNKSAIAVYEDKYKKERIKLKSLDLPTASELEDIILWSTTQSPKR